VVFLIYSRRERKPGSPGSEVEKPGGNQAARIRVDRQKTSSLEMSSFSERGRERRESDSVPDRTLATPCERLGTGARQFRSGDRRSAKAARVSVRIRYGGEHFYICGMSLVRLAKSQLRTEHIWDRMLNVGLLSPRSISPKRCDLDGKHQRRPLSYGR
jgi:hypothetical protein